MKDYFTPGIWLRFGGLSPVKQSQFGSSTFHSPPRRSGCYAFVSGYVERFLLSSSAMQLGHRSNALHRVYDEHGMSFCWDEHVSESAEGIEISCGLKKALRRLGRQKRRNLFEVDGVVCLLRRPRRFRYEGLLWHHLEVQKESAILERKGAWVLTAFADWKKAFQQRLHRLRQQMHTECWEQCKQWGQLEFDPFRGPAPTATFTRDELEVFIERP